MEFRSYKDSIQLLSQKNSANCRDCICASPFVKYVLPSFLVVLLILTFTHFGLLTWLPLDDRDNQATCHLQPSYYVPCSPGRPAIPKDECLQLGCCWREDARVCYHSYPSRYGYKVDGYRRTPYGVEGNVTASRKYSPSGKLTRDRLGFQLRQIDADNFQMALITSAKGRRQNSSSSSSSSGNSSRGSPWRRSITTLKTKKLSDYGHLFDFMKHDAEARVAEFSLSDNATKILLHEPQFSLSVVRDEDELLFSTARGPLIMTDNYWELTLYLANGSDLRGLGALQLNGTTNWIYNNENQTIKPVLLALTANLACSLDYQAPIEIQVLNGSNLVILRGISIPEASLRINIYTNANSSETIEKLSDPRSQSGLLAFDRLGLQLCPDQHENLTAAVDSLRDLMNSTRAGLSHVPWDSHCLSRRHLGLTLDQLHDSAELGLVDEARKMLEPRALVAHLSPMVTLHNVSSFEIHYPREIQHRSNVTSTHFNLFLKDTTFLHQLFNRPEGPLQSILEKESCLLGNGSGTYVGMYVGKGVVYPEWTNLKTHEIAMGQLDEYLKRLQLGYVVLRDAWPRDEIPHNTSDESFDYLPKGLRHLMSNGTVPFDLQDRRHYTTHNSYASSFANFAGSKGVELRGHECNSPDTEVGWLTLLRILEVGVVDSMSARVPSAMYVCGANWVKINDELCVRWYALAVAWPRILATPDKSPFIGSRLSRSSKLQVARLLQLRATLTTYHRTTLASFASHGNPVLADTAFYYPPDGDHNKQPRYASQFFWGDSILVGLVLLPRHYQVPMWLPGEYSWKLVQGGSSFRPSTNGSGVPVTVAMGEVALLVRPGRIIPVHEEAGDSSTSSSMKNLNLLANPACSSSSGNCRAEGRVYYGDDDASRGEFLLVSYTNGSLTLSNVLGVKEVACSRERLPTRTSDTFLTLQILGAEDYVIDVKLCQLRENVTNVELAKARGSRI